MAIHEEQIRKMGAGQAKSINSGAMSMVFDILQKSQYNFPVQSTIREIASNAIDSINEKHMARNILTGKAKVEDYFANVEDITSNPDDLEKYRDSKFVPEYYDLQYLSDQDIVLIHYISGGAERDRIEVSDTGVGMGPERLQGYFELGYSTKRLSKLPLGKWGIGAKSPLSVGVNYYTLESVYNGYKYRFNIYAQSYDSIIPKFNLETGAENPHVVFGEDYKVYAEPTTEKNGVKITIGAKKAHKKQYIDAVKSQLLYFDHIIFKVTEDDGSHSFIPYKANILYEDDYIILSDNLYYTKPHLLLNKVNYGYINWEELELQDRSGNIGIKVAPEDIEVTPSREGVIWSEKTKEMVNQRFKDVQGIAERAIQKELTETDFWKWIRICFSIGQRYSHNGIDVISRLAKIVDLSELQPTFNPVPTIKFTPNTMLSGLAISFIHMEYEAVQNRRRSVVRRKELKSIGSHINYPIFYMPGDEIASNRKSKYLLTIYPNGFLIVKEPLTEEKMRESGFYTEEWIQQIVSLRKERSGGVPPETLYELLVASDDVMDYTAVVVPEDFKASDSEEIEKDEKSTDQEEEKEKKTSLQTAAERRKLEEKILIYTPRILGQPVNNQLFVSQKLEHKISEINNWDAEEIYYGTEADDEVIHLVAALTRDPHPGNDMTNENRRSHATSALTPSIYDHNTRAYKKDTSRLGWDEMKWMRKNRGLVYSMTNAPIAFQLQHFFDNKQIKLVKVAQSNVKYVRDFKHIQQFFISIRNKKISMSNVLIKWNTARLIKAQLHKAAFLYNFSSFNEQYAEKYNTLVSYVARHYREVEIQASGNYYGINEVTYTDLIKHLDVVALFQGIVRTSPDDKELIASTAESLFGNKDLEDGMAMESEMMEMLNDVLEYVKAVGNALNYMPILTGYKEYQYKFLIVANGSIRDSRQPIPEHLEQEIKLYLEYKGVLDYGFSTPGTNRNNEHQDSQIMSQDNGQDVQDPGVGEALYSRTAPTGA